MEFLDVINMRQSIRKYQEGDIPNEDLRAIIEAAGKAPSGKTFKTGILWRLSAEIYCKN